MKNVNEVLGPMVVGMDPTKQQDLDDVSAAVIPYSATTPFFTLCFLGVSCCVFQYFAHVKRDM